MYRRKSKTSSNSSMVATIFFATFAYGLLSDPTFVARVEAIVKYALIVVISIIFATFTIRLARKVNSRGLKMVDAMTGVEFEHYVAKLLAKQGYKHISLTEQYDYGIDIIAEKDDIKWGIQVKRHTGLVKALAVRQAVTALKKYGCDRAMVISNSKFSRAAVELARTNDCILVERSKLVSWMTA